MQNIFPLSVAGVILPYPIVVATLKIYKNGIFNIYIPDPAKKNEL